MAHIKFHLLEEVELGSLPDDLKERWEALMKLETRIGQMTETYENQKALIFQEVKEKMDVHPDHSRDEPEVEIDVNGQVFQKFCDCPTCQAKVQGLPLGVVIEALLAEGLINSEEADAVRKVGAEEQAAKDAAQKRRLMMN